MESNSGNSGSAALASEYIGFGPCGIWLSPGDEPQMLAGIAEIASTRENGPPGIPVAILDASGIHEEMREVLKRVYPLCLACLDDGVVERGDLGPLIGDAEEESLPSGRIPGLLSEDRRPFWLLLVTNG